MSPSDQWWYRGPTTRVFTTFWILEISYILNVFFVSYSIRKWPKFREIIRDFSMQIFTKFCGISRNSVTCYTNFFNDSAQRTFSTHSRETSRRWLGGGGGTTVHHPTPTPSLLPVGCLRHFVYSKFRIFWMFFLFRIPFENILLGFGFKFQ